MSVYAVMLKAISEQTVAKTAAQMAVITGLPVTGAQDALDLLVRDGRVTKDGSDYTIVAGKRDE